MTTAEHNQTINNFSNVDQKNIHDMLHNKLAVAVFGGLAMLGTIGGISACGGEQSTTNTTETVDETPSQETITTTIDSSVFTPETDPTTGNIRPAAIFANDDTFQMYWNNQMIQIPRIRTYESLDTPESVNRYVSSVQAVVACYVTTRDTSCLNAFSPSQTARGYLLDQADNNTQIYNDQLDRVVPKTGPVSEPDNEWQYAIYDDPTNPAVFTVTDLPGGGRRISLTAGDMYTFTNTLGSVWQGPQMHRVDTNKEYMRFLYNEFYVDLNEANEIVDYEYSSKQANYQ